MRRLSGFTLIELMVTVAIVAILAAVAMPAYSDYVLQSKLADAFSSLSSMRVKLEQYYQDNRSYVGACAAGTVAPLPTAADSRRFTYACNLAADTFTVTATGVAAEGTGGFVFTIDQANAKATTSVPAGWTANATCWTTKKGGTC